MLDTVVLGIKEILISYDGEISEILRTLHGKVTKGGVFTTFDA